MGSQEFHSVPVKVAMYIKEMIFNNKEYGPNDKLPNELDLADLFNVSRNSVREAIRILESQGILRVDRGKGTFVTSELKQETDLLDISEIKDKAHLLKDWYQFRLILEPVIAEQAAIYGNTYEIEKIRSWEQACRKKIENGESYAIEDRSFHSAIAIASHNLVLEHIMPKLSVAIEDSITLVSAEHPHITAENALYYHDKIAFYIEQGSGSSAKAVMNAHLQLGMDQLAKYLD